MEKSNDKLINDFLHSGDVDDFEIDTQKNLQRKNCVSNNLIELKNINGKL